MIILDLRVDNFYSFRNFHVNFSYPKKIVGSYIEDEYLEGRKNFRYKKINIIMGSNATGKTTLGFMMMNIFNFIEWKTIELLTESISDRKKTASFTIDLVGDNYKMYRVNCVISPKKTASEAYKLEDISVHVADVDILQRDSYETCAKKLDDKMDLLTKTVLVDELEKVKGLSWLFESPADNKNELTLPSEDSQFLEILKKVLMALDPAIKNVKKVQNVKGAFAIDICNRSVIIQDGDRITTKYLSSGTKAGIGVACVLYSIMHGKTQFYYCDEKFSYIHSDIEKAVLAKMIEKIKTNEQLFFTTHNTEVLDMNLPKHSFMFMRKRKYDEDYEIECVDASSFLKRNTDSLKKAVENDLFSVSPSTELIYELD